MLGDDVSLLRTLATARHRDGWWETAAVVLPLVHALDAWSDLEDAGAAADAAEVAAAGADAIDAQLADAVTDAKLAASALRVSAGLRARPPARREVLAGANEAGVALFGMGLPDAAARVFEAVLRHARLDAAEAEIALEAHIELGRCELLCSTLDSARAMLHGARRLARRQGLPRQQAVATLALAVCDYRAGLLDHAERRARRVLRAARRAGWREEAANARQMLGNVASTRDDRREALRHFARAFPHIRPRWRERCLCDLGASLMMLGYFREAWETLTLVNAAGHDRVARHGAAINLLVLAAYLGDREEFERRRRDLTRAGQVPPVSLGALHCLIGEGYHHFGELALARAEYQTAIALATEHGARDWVVKSEQGIAALAGPPVAPPSLVTEVRATVTSALRHVRELRKALADA